MRGSTLGDGRHRPDDQNALVRSLLIDLTPIRTSKAYRNLWLGGGLSGIGATLVSIVVALQVYNITGSTLQVGFVGLASFIPLLVLGLYGGSVVDAYDRRKVLVYTQIGQTLVGIVLANPRVLLDMVDV